MAKLDILLNKKVSIERCITQIKHYYADANKDDFARDYLHQDAISINLQRCCELCIDLANMVIRSEKLGLPKSSRESFELLYQAGHISKDTYLKLAGMVGFRNVLIHEYINLDIAILVDVIENQLQTPLKFAQIILELEK